MACFVALLARPNRGSGLIRTYSDAVLPPRHYDIDLSGIGSKRVSHLQVQLLPRIDAQLGVIEAIVDDNPTGRSGRCRDPVSLKNPVSSSCPPASEVTLTSTGVYPSVPRRLPADAVVSVLIKKNVICFRFVPARIATACLALGAPTLQRIS